MPEKIKISEVIRRAIDGQDAAWAGRIVDFLRFHRGLKYAQIVEIVRAAGRDPDDWEDLMSAADSAEANG